MLGKNSISNEESDDTEQHKYNIIILLFTFICAVIFFGIVILLFLNIIFLSLFIYKEFISLFNMQSLLLHEYVSSMAIIVEFILFEIVLFILANGIYVCIIQPIFDSAKYDFSLKEMFKDFIEYLSRPFLMVVASILIVSVFHIIIELYATTLSIKDSDLDKYFYFSLLLIFFIFIAVITISLLMKIEKSIIHSN